MLSLVPGNSKAHEEFCYNCLSSQGAVTITCWFG